MSPIRIIILVFALAAAGGAAFLVSRMSAPGVVTETVTRDQLVLKEKEVSSVEVLTVTKNFMVGEVITKEDLEWSPWPEANVVEGFALKSAAPTALEDTVGAIVKTALFDGEPVLPQKIVRKGDQSLLAAIMEPGMRAVSVEISAESASGGFVLPNDRVDLILTYDQKAPANSGGSERTLAKTIIQNVRVLAIDQTFRMESKEGESATQLGRTATLEVRPDEAELVAMAQRMGQVSLSLRPLAAATETNRAARIEMLEGEGAGAGIIIIRNGQPAPAGVGGN